MARDADSIDRSVAGARVIATLSGNVLAVDRVPCRGRVGDAHPGEGAVVAALKYPDAIVREDDRCEGWWRRGGRG